MGEKEMTRCKNNDDCLLYGSRAAVLLLLLFVVCRNVMEAHSEFQEEIKKREKKKKFASTTTTTATTATTSLPNMKSALGSYCVIKRQFRNEPTHVLLRPAHPPVCGTVQYSSNNWRDWVGVRQHKFRHRFSTSSSSFFFCLFFSSSSSSSPSSSSFQKAERKDQWNNKEAWDRLVSFCFVFGRLVP